MKCELDVTKQAEYKSEIMIIGCVVGKMSLGINGSSRVGRPRKTASFRMEGGLSIAEFLMIKQMQSWRTWEDQLATVLNYAVWEAFEAPTQPFVSPQEANAYDRTDFKKHIWS